MSPFKVINELGKFARVFGFGVEVSSSGREFAAVVRELMSPLVWLPALCTLVILTPYFFMLDESAFNGARIVELVFIVLAGSVGLFTGINSSHRRECCLLTLIIIAVLSLVSSQYLFAAMQELGRFFAIALLVFVYSDRLGNRQREVAIILLLIPAAGYCVHFLFDFALNVFDVGRRYIDMVGFKNRRTFNQVQVVLLPLLLSLLTFEIVERVRFLKSTVFCVCVIWCFSALFSGGRGAVLSISVAFFILFIFSRGNKMWRQRIPTLVAVLFSAAILYFIYYYFSPEKAPEYILRGGSSGRLELWSDVIFSGEISLLGNGPQSYVDFSWRQYGPSKMPYSTPHNSMISTLYEYGVFGMVMLVFLAMFLFKCLTEKLRCGANFTVMAAIWSLLSLFCYSAFSGIQYSSITGILLPLIGGVVISNREWKQRDSFVSANRFNLVVLVSLVFSVIYVLVTASWVLFYGCELGPKTCDGNYIHTTMPRFFERGEYFMIDDIPDSYRERFLR